MSGKQLLYERVSRYAAVTGDFFKHKVVIGVIGVLMLYASIAMVGVLTWPWWPNVGDGPYHADYVHQLYNGNLPVWDDGIQYPAFKEKVNAPDSGYPGDYKHIVSQHPPLFYVIQAPFMGPLMNSGEWEKALAVGRTINVVLGMILGALMAYAAWLYGGSRNKHRLVILTPLFGLMIGQFINLSRGLVNDILITIFATLAIIMIYHIYKKGLSLRRIFLYSIIVSLGMLSKATFVAVLIPSYLLILYLTYKNKRNISLRKIIIYLVLPVMMVSLLSGWFYARNYIQSGNPTRAGAQEWISDRREPKDLRQVLTTPPFYDIFHKQLTTHHYTEISTFITVVLVVSVLNIIIRGRKKIVNSIRSNKLLLITIGCMGILLVFAQIVHAIPYGMFNIRYFFPLLFPVSFIAAFALMRIPVSRIYSGILVGIVMAFTYLYSTAISVDTIEEGLISRLRVGLSQNNIPEAIIYPLIALSVVAIILVVYSLYTPKKAATQRQ